MTQELEQATINLLLRDTIAAVYAASREVEKIYNSSDFGVNMKSDSTPLTKADKVSDREIRERLMHTYIPLLSEEGRFVPYEERANWPLFWLVDPIDGTKEFIKKNGEFTVNVALIQNRTPIIGVISLPAHHKLYFAASGVGSYRVENMDFNAHPDPESITLEELLAQGQKLPIPREPGHKFTVVNSRSHLAPEMASYLEKIRSKHPDMDGHHPYGSSLKFCMVAEGSADLYPRITDTYEWDTAAGQAICAFANAEVVTMKEKEKEETQLIYNTETMKNPSFVARQCKNDRNA